MSAAVGVPQRLDLRTDVGIEEYAALGCQLRVWVDGVEIERVVAYDIAAGLAWRQVVDDEGYPVADESGERVRVTVEHGVITVERAEWPG